MKTPEQWANEIVVECSLSPYDLPALARWVRRVQQDARKGLALEIADSVIRTRTASDKQEVGK